LALIRFDEYGWRGEYLDSADFGAGSDRMMAAVINRKTLATLAIMGLRLQLIIPCQPITRFHRPIKAT
jgi:hypothetical protein